MPDILQNLQEGSKGVVNYLSQPNTGPGKDTVTINDPFSTNYTNRTKELSPVQYLSTFNKDFKAQNPEYAAMHAYSNPYQTDQSMGYNVGSFLKNHLSKGYKLYSDYANQGPAGGALAGALPAAAAGLLGTGVANYLSGNDMSDNMVRNSILAALLGGGVGAYSGHLRSTRPAFSPMQAGVQPIVNRTTQQNELRQALQPIKNAAYKMVGDNTTGMDTRQYILAALSDAPGLSFNERAQLTAGTASLSNNDLTQLKQLLISAGGASVGALVSKFLMNKGLIGTVLGAILGSSVAKAVFGTHIPTNALGQQMYNSFN